MTDDLDQQNQEQSRSQSLNQGQNQYVSQSQASPYAQTQTQAQVQAQPQTQAQVAGFPRFQGQAQPDQPLLQPQMPAYPGTGGLQPGFPPAPAGFYPAQQAYPQNAAQAYPQQPNQQQSYPQQPNQQPYQQPNPQQLYQQPYAQPGAPMYPPSPMAPPAPRLLNGGPIWLLAVAGAAAAFIGLSVVAAVIVSLVFTLSPVVVSDATYLGVTNIAFQLLAAVVAFLWYRKLASRHATTPVLFKGVPTYLDAVNPRTNLLRQGSARELALTVAGLFALGILFQIAFSSILTIIQSISPDTMAEYNELMDQIVSDSPLQFVSAVILAPLCEELFFRGVALEYGRRCSPKFYVGIIAQAIAFGVAHLNLIQGSYAGLLGLVLGLIALRFGGLPASMLIHFALNLSGYFTDVLLWPFLQLDIPGLILSTVLSTALIALIMQHGARHSVASPSSIFHSA